MRYLSVLMFFITVTTHSQVLKPDAAVTYYSEMWNVYNAHKRISYIAPLPAMNVNKQWGAPVLFEANISPYFIFFRGRDYGNEGYSRPQLKSFMVYFNPELTLRMYQEDPIGVPTKSLPVMPISFVPRISFVKFIHRSSIENKIENFQTFRFFEFSIAHYSNGQENPHYLQDTLSVAGDSIPNYAGGNFSTNYLRLGYTYGFLDDKLNIYSFNPYVQNDGGAGDLFSFDPAMLKSYGKWRLGITLQFQSGKKRIFTKKRQKVDLVPEDSASQSALDKFDPVRKPSIYYATWMVRFNSETIVDDVSEYPSDKKLINATRVTVVFHPLNWRNFALMTELYYGRDFYNIRFYDRLIQWKLGLVADGNFFLPRDTYSH